MLEGKSFGRRNFKKLQLTPAALEPNPVDPPPLPLISELGLASNEASTRLKRFSQQPSVGKVVDVHRIRSEDLEKLGQLGRGNGGTVCKVLHKPSGIYMAKKTIYMESTPQVRKHIVTELETLKMCDSDFIVRYYGQYVKENQLVVCMEFMDCGSLDKIYKTHGAFSENVVAFVNAAVVDGLVYLKQLHITHRDIKPSNILVNRNGDIKLCDFGVSGVLINSIAQTFVGTSMYMSPERIQGDEYTDAGDVWSLGLTLVELAKGEFPFTSPDGANPPPIFELLQSIVQDPVPEPPSHFSSTFKQYVSQCLQKIKEDRITVRQLNQTPFYVQARSAQMNPLRQWAAQLQTL